MFYRLDGCSSLLHGAASHHPGTMMAAKNRITVNLEDAEYEALQRIAERSERSLAWIGRRAICDFIEQRAHEDEPLFAGQLGISSHAQSIR
jgi:hypothetical protein